MLSWDQICGFIASGALERLHRTFQVTARYQEYRKQLSLENTTVADAILDRKLCWDRTELASLDPRTTPPLSSTQLYKLLKNDFPYDLDPRAHHLVLWSKIYIPLYPHPNSREMDPTVRDLIQSFLEANLALYNIHKFTWFINYPHLQSVKTLSHIHILIFTEDTKVIDEILKKGFPIASS